MRFPLRVGRYEIHERLLGGGMATIHVGRLQGAAGFARTVAVKRMLPSVAEDREFVRLFASEARLAARVDHPNVGKTLDVIDEGAELFLVLDYVHGESLARLLGAAREAGDRVPLGVAVAIMHGVCSGLHAAHEASDEAGRLLRIVHRDLAPQNVLVGVDGVARVIDFGLAKALGATALTTGSEFRGSLGYAAPEHVRLDAIDHRADVYSAGVVLWELLAGRRLFAGMTHTQILAARTAGEPLPPLDPAEVPDALVGVVVTATSADPASRFATSKAMADALLAAAQPASPSEVSAWVLGLAQESLARRERFVRAAERGEDAEPVEASGGGLSVASPPRGVGRWAIAVAGLVVGISVPVVGQRLMGRPHDPLAAPAASTSSPAAESARAPSGPPAPDVTTAAADPPPSPPQPRVGTKAAVPKPAAAPAACSPPHYFDAEGIRRVKPGCG